MSSNNIYYVFGLYLKVNFEIPELLKVHESEDGTEVEVDFNQINNFPLEVNLQEGWYKTENHNLYFLVEGVAKFFVSNGNRIEIETFAGVDEDNIRLYLLGSALAGIIHQRKYLPLHASAILYKGKAILFSADSGFGKSTLCMALKLRGFNVVSDDVCCFVDTENGFKINSGYPQLKLWKESVELFDVLDSKELPKVRKYEEKFKIKVNDDFCFGSFDVRAIFFLSIEDRGDVMIDNLSPINSLTYFQSNIFRPFFVSDKTDIKNNFKKIVSIIDNTEIFKISRPSKGNSLELMIENILKTLN